MFLKVVASRTYFELKTSISTFKTLNFNTEYVTGDIHFQPFQVDQVQKNTIQSESVVLRYSCKEHKHLKCIIGCHLSSPVTVEATKYVKWHETHNTWLNCKPCSLPPPSLCLVHVSGSTSEWKSTDCNNQAYLNVVHSCSHCMLVWVSAKCRRFKCSLFYSAAPGNVFSPCFQIECGNSPFRANSRWIKF